MAALGNTFKSGEPSLSEVLKNIENGNIQLPDFQRGWVWDDEHIRSLIASVSLSYPIGAVMLLETGGNNVNFKPRAIEGTTPSESIMPQQLILDGQQRMTSLFLALKSGRPVPIPLNKKETIEKIYYLDIKKCVNESEDRFDAVISISPEKTKKSDFGRVVDLDLSSQEKEFENLFLPLSLIFDNIGYSNWKMKCQQYYNFCPEKIGLLNDFELKVWHIFQQYRVPTIELLRDTPKEAVCQVFEKVNTGGVVLTVFELVTATFASNGFELRKNWDKREERLHKIPVLKGVDATSFLTAVTLYTSYQNHEKTKKPVSCKRGDILKLTLEDYKKNEEAVELGMIKAAKLLVRENIYDVRAIPYQTQIVPLTAICAILQDKFEEDGVKQKISQWLWCGVFGELYGGANETRFALDVTGVVEWINGGEPPKSYHDANFTPTRLLTLQTRLSAAYKGVMAKLISYGCKDFINGDQVNLTTYFVEAVDIHHIFPSKYCMDNKYDQKFWNSVVNKTPLSARTNKILSGNAPSKYIDNIENKQKVESNRLSEILITHLINPDQLRNDNFDLFIRTRASNLLDMIEKAMGKSVQGRDSDEVIKAFGAALTRLNSINN